MINFLRLSAFELAALIKKKEATPLEIFDVHAELIEKYNPILNAAVELNLENGRKQAQKYTSGLMNKKELPPLYGVPFTCKEMFSIKGFKRTGGNVYYKNQVSTETATIFDRISKAGGILLATTNVPEFGFWFETNNQVYGRTSNPYNEKRTSGGSSGGEGALIGLGASPFGLASDIGGSIRIPASFCGVFGHKPSAGIIPLTGHFPMSHATLKALPLDKYPMTTSGPLCRSAKDLRPLIQILKGPDGIDPRCRAVEFDLKISKPKKIFFISDPLIQGASSTSLEVQTNIIKSVNYLREVGYPTEELPRDFFIKGLDLWFNILNKIDHVPFADLVSPEKKLNFLQELPKLILGTSSHTLPTYILSLMEFVKDKTKDETTSLEIARLSSLLDQLKSKLNRLLNNENVLLFPTQPQPAPLHDYLLATPFDYIYCGIFNALENPSTQVPIGMSSKELPIGMQIVGPLNYDHLGISLAEELELAFGGWTPPRFKS